MQPTLLQAAVRDLEHFLNFFPTDYLTVIGCLYGTFLLLLIEFFLLRTHKS